MRPIRFPRRPDRAPNVLLGAALLAAALLAAALLAAGPAAAHAVVTTSDPAAGATLATPPARVAVQFNSRIDHGRSRLTLVGPDGAATVLDPAPPAEPSLLAAPTTGTGWAPGAWRLRWQVLAVDGHITRGDIPFTLRAP